MADNTVNALQPTPTGTSRFFTLSPCRAVDTRDSTVYPRGLPALAGGQQRAFALAGVCGVPATAKAISANVTIASPTSIGYLRLFPVGVAAPLVSTINFYPGQTRANSSVVQVGGGSTASLTVQNDGAGPVEFILDVNGYFE